MTLDAVEFIRRFLLYVLPANFQRIRYFGFRATRRQNQNVALCRRLLAMPPTAVLDEASADRREPLLGRRPACGRGRMLLVAVVAAVGEEAA